MEHGNDTAYKLMQAFIQLNRQRMHSGPIAGMTHRELGVLRSLSKLDDGQGVMVSELSARLKVSAPSITQTVNGLVTRGLVDRAADLSDRRVVRLRVTPSGQEALALVSKEFHAQFQGLVSSLGEEKSTILTDLLHQAYQYFHIIG